MGQRGHKPLSTGFLLQKFEVFMTPTVTAFFDEATNTVSYVVADPETKTCAIIDSVLDFEQASGRTSTASADKLLEFINQQNLEVIWILETHAHADHLSAAQYLKSRTAGRYGIGRHITAVQAVFKSVFHLGPEMPVDGSQFDRLFEDKDVLPLGNMHIDVMHTPGHTPACLTYVVGDAVFVGDTLFMPDYGTARVDFPGGDAATLYQSIQRILALPAESRLFMCHDYKAPGRDEYAWQTSVAEERAKNIHIHDGITEQEFVEFRNKRDAGLNMPQLILPSIQINIDGGKMPKPEANGVSYLKLPINAL
jgi:glyoxylase-like metal-dependent hydrolase (beta-lactamase superfamily II)